MSMHPVSVKSESHHITKPNSYFLMKKVIDVSVSLTLLILLLPVFVVIALILYKKETGPVFLKQMRVGKNNRPFMMYNFSTTTPASKVIHAFPPYPHPPSWNDGLPDELHMQRQHCLVTRTGKWMQKYHIEKLPQLWNVLKGDMSLVGPEPECPDIACHYNHYQANRLKVKPGMTGYAQIHFLSNSQHSKKLRFDLFYINNCSARLDTKIVFRAIVFAIKGK